MKKERSIKIAFDRKSGKKLFADEIFDDRLIGYDYRLKYNRNEIEPICVECDEKLIVSPSKYQKLYFRHNESDTPCILKENLTPHEKDVFARISFAKESDRHIFLKNLIGQKLSIIEGVRNVQIDNHFIFDGLDKRRPDVYFEYFDKKIVFEIQLSNLSQRYILSRYDFYKKKGIFLIWLLDDLNIVEHTSQMEKDLKHLSNHQNFFKLDENSHDFTLKCKFKSTHLSTTNNYYDEWKNVQINLQKLQFDTVNIEAYFYNFGIEKRKKLDLQKEYLEKVKKEEREKAEKERIERINLKVTSIISKIKKRRSNPYPNFDDIANELSKLNFEETNLLNSKLSFDSNSAILRYIKNAVDEHYTFLSFLLTSSQINYDINLKDDTGTTVISALFTNQNFKHKIPLFRKIISKGYLLTKTDEIYLYKYFDYKPSEAEWHILIANIAKHHNEKWIIESLFEHMEIIRIIESAKQEKIVGFAYKPNEWVNFANNAVQYHSKYWEYISVAFKEYGLFEKLNKLDTKGTFRKKLFNYYSQPQITDYEFENTFKTVYPELCGE